MIGLGKWKANLSSLYVKGEVEFTIADKDGEYDIDIKMPEKFKGATLLISEIREVGTNKLCGKGRISVFPSKEIDAEFTFTDTTVEGVLSLGKVGSVKVKDGVKIG